MGRKEKKLMAGKLDTLVLARQRVAYRAPAVVATGVLFTIIGGPVWILGFFMYSVLAQATGATITVLCNGVAMDAGDFNYNGAAGCCTVWELQGAVPVTAVCTPMPQLGALPVDLGILASHNGAANTIAAVGAGAPVNPVSFHVVYQAMAPNSQII